MKIYLTIKYDLYVNKKIARGKVRGKSQLKIEKTTKNYFNLRSIPCDKFQ